ncbi:MAG TPA: pyruvate ferredoxin oxidoreductase [Firmicutes bacterium]|nr:pyruvate ferredoxin oxidoreductase [Bacillota bacterium]
MVQRVLEGSRGVAEAVALCRPQVVAAYPITPQTHITENLAQLVADGDLKAEYVTVESEHSAASVVLGASATGARAYTATASQGLFLMTEVLFNIAGLRLPIVLTCANRAVSAPINIWNDQQDSVALRDSGWIQLYAEDNQEAVDLHLQAFKIAEREDVQLPVMVCLDGYVLTHAYQPLSLPTQEEVDAFLPPRRSYFALDPAHPLTLGGMAGPELYPEIRAAHHAALVSASRAIQEVGAEFRERFGRGSAALVEGENLAGAEVAIVAMGSVVSTVREAAVQLAAAGKKAAVVKVRAFRPFPAQEIRALLKAVPEVWVLEKDISLGSGGALWHEVRSALAGVAPAPRILGFVAGLGGRDVTPSTVEAMAAWAAAHEAPAAAGPIFIDVGHSAAAERGEVR